MVCDTHGTIVYAKLLALLEAVIVFPIWAGLTKYPVHYLTIVVIRGKHFFTDYILF